MDDASSAKTDAIPSTKIDGMNLKSGRFFTSIHTHHPQTIPTCPPLSNPNVKVDDTLAQTPMMVKAKQTTESMLNSLLNSDLYPRVANVASSLLKDDTSPCSLLVVSDILRKEVRQLNS